MVRQRGFKLRGGAVYLHELIGLEVKTTDGTLVGTVLGYFELAHGILLEIRRGKETVLMPYRDEFIAEVNTDERVLVVDPPEGLFEGARCAPPSSRPSPTFFAPRSSPRSRPRRRQLAASSTASSTCASTRTTSIDRSTTTRTGVGQGW